MHCDATPRKSLVAGRFYPAQADTLRAELAAYLTVPAGGPLPLGDKIPLAAMVPHAGYVFSGAVAGATLAQAALADTMVLLGPNHTGRGAPLAVWSGGPWLTPLGAVPVAADLASELVESGSGFSGDCSAHTAEHSLEVLLPFLQVLRPALRIVPVVAALADLPSLQMAGEALAACVQRRTEQGERVSVVVSSDMSHYLPHENAKALDALALEKIMALDPEGLYQTVRARNISMCGVLPMTLALFACSAMGATAGHLVAYATSGQTGQAYGADMQSVVGYAGALIV